LNDEEFRKLQDEKLANQRRMIELLVEIKTTMKHQGSSLKKIEKFSQVANRENGQILKVLEVDSAKNRRNFYLFMVIVIGAFCAIAGVDYGIQALLSFF
jgi:hypothetical protein